MIAFIRKHAAVIIGILVIITVSTVVLTFVIANNHNNVNTTSSEDSDNIQLLNETFGFDFVDNQVYSIQTMNHNSSEVPSTEVVVKFNITAEQLRTISDYAVIEEFSPGDYRFFDREDISSDTIKTHAVSWKEKVVSSPDTALECCPYELNWYILEKGIYDKYDAIASSYIPFGTNIKEK